MLKKRRTFVKIQYDLRTQSFICIFITFPHFLDTFTFNAFPPKLFLQKLSSSYQLK